MKTIQAIAYILALKLGVVHIVKSVFCEDHEGVNRLHFNYSDAYQTEMH